MDHYPKEIMRSALTLLVFLCGAVWAQQPAKPGPADEAPDDSTVLATLGDGHKVTYGELRMYLTALPPQQQQMALRNRKALVEQYALMRKLVQLALDAKLQDQSP